MRTVWTFHSAVQIVFGRDAVKQLRHLQQAHQLASLLVVKHRRNRNVQLQLSLLQNTIVMFEMI